ncbi:superfamily II DNA/RNA helicase [Actinoplanes campanulatus]|uniref:Superfamily II DNA/RNA helicase n=1 Tax=Actinoplanes campanulatus TaxID=113559 RepID=A0A7W5AAT9_9ACTN|nr:DEAD/DEAH box helicase [Actinoplanes campanulatus]MBB3092570.1 superfamily II DNA/RNA helicase [Actinoplanes campanulatus]GGM97484.1 RNA helicase [Actinoplanes campanulatus]GID34335.1 RNA helicase [Actinoplanes campanulatus]
MQTFTELGVPAVLTTALDRLGITTPFPIQAATLPDSLAGRDVLGRGRTGSGKTYAFAIPVVARLAASRAPARPGRPRALILAPTRELATQIEATVRPLADAAGLRTLVVFGGVGPNPQIKALKAGVDVLVACPGRLDDHIRGGHASLEAVEVTVLDEADHMADLGFLPVVRRLMSQTPSGGQRLLFSATLDNGVDVLVRSFMHKPVTHHVDSAAQAPVEMDHHVLHVRDDDRFGVLVELLAAPGRSVVFTRTKRRAKVLTRQLNAAGVPAVELHGNLAQNARNRNLSAFSDGTAGTLVATDIAARGIHVDDVALVIHADPPVEHKAYLHRSGRTARAGARGTVITLMTDEQQADVRDLARKAGIRPVTTRTRPGDALLAELAPGERTFTAPVTTPPASRPAPSRPASPEAPAEGTAGRSRRPRRGRGASPESSASAAQPSAPATTGRPRTAAQEPTGRPRTAGPAREPGGESQGRVQSPGRRRGARRGAGSGQSPESGQAQREPSRGSGQAQRGSGQARGSASTPRSGTPQQRTTSGGGAAAFSTRFSDRRSGR